jgi:hypothetical protein
MPTSGGTQPNLVMDYSGQHFQYPRLTYKAFGGPVLNKGCPWESVDIGKGVVMDRMVFPAMPVQHIFL